MNNDLLYGILIAIIFIWLWRRSREGYSNKREKAETIYNWWKQNPSNEYSNYKKQVPKSDVVEYNKVSELKNGGGLSIDAIEQVIS